MSFLTSCQESISFSTEEVKNQINQSQIIVDIKGAVVFPGIYSIDENMLLIDVVKLAGGFTDQADTTNINLAMPIGNNQMIIIPLIKETNVNQTENNLININTSSLTELTVLPGIGETKAQNIIDYRTNNGNFTSINTPNKKKSHFFKKLNFKSNIEIKCDLYSDGKDLLDNLNNELDAVFLDIDMPNPNGIEIANTINEKFPELNIVFVTNRTELVFDIIKFRPIGFVRKNEIENEIIDAITRVQNEIFTKSVIYHNITKNSTVKIKLNDIIYLETTYIGCCHFQYFNRCYVILRETFHYL